MAAEWGAVIPGQARRLGQGAHPAAAPTEMSGQALRLSSCEPASQEHQVAPAKAQQHPLLPRGALLPLQFDEQLGRRPSAAGCEQGRAQVGARIPLGAETDPQYNATRACQTPWLGSAA
jgi:hypothetical protein